ncbi:hypothetical protein GQ44DRAFT_156821 [Phaeosphaeriaceae sp. PMI808]|nr:hypothetical protein GQ44DRAFT_156821 [Phaeosphaeriaceae sp. PMI808]
MAKPHWPQGCEDLLFGAKSKGRAEAISPHKGLLGECRSAQKWFTRSYPARHASTAPLLLSGRHGFLLSLLALPRSNPRPAVRLSRPSTHRIAAPPTNSPKIAGSRSSRDASPWNMGNGSSLRSSSPSKRRRREDDSLLGQSASRTGSIVVSERTVLTAPSSAKRTPSLSRHLTELRTARPSISLSPITMPAKPLSDDAMTRLAG